MISLTNHDFQWGRSEVVIIYPDEWNYQWIGLIDENLRKNHRCSQSKWGFDPVKHFPLNQSIEMNDKGTEWWSKPAKMVINLAVCSLF